MSVAATCLGFPRIGIHRELKKALESYWRGTSSGEALRQTASELRRRHWSVMKARGIEIIPSNDFSLYDHMLDAAITVGAIPERYRQIDDPLARLFAMARGYQDVGAGIDVAALEMTKWFDTNYHYIVPELETDQVFQLDFTKILEELGEAKEAGFATRPVLVGPVTFLLLSKLAPGAPRNASVLDSLDALLTIYEELLCELKRQGVAWVQLDEPCLVLDLDQRAGEAYSRALRRLAAVPGRPRILLATYFGPVADNLSLVVRSGLDGLHVDLARAPDQLDDVLAAIPETMSLSLGLVDGRNIWRTDLDGAHARLRTAVMRLGEDRVLVAPSCSLLHVPVEAAVEKKLDDELRGWLSFATEKLHEVRALADTAQSERPANEFFSAARAARSGRISSPRTFNPAVRERARAIHEGMLRRASAYPERAEKQKARLGLPLLPTTTIGSFPQTGDVRGARAAWRGDRMDPKEYQAFLEEETKKCIEKQEALGLDVLVHGEFERNDMVEYFGEQLDGFAFTENGWVQSYGSRCVKPPVLFGDVARGRPMTVAWSTFAQSLTKRPMKGMLTGPVTILKWSFVRDDQPLGDTCGQIALALRDEVRDLEDAGIVMIQVDEPAIREGLPLRRRDWAGYLRWAVDSFRLATSGARDETQIHSHMCYAEFGDILDAIVEMDADVLSIETSRSKMELLADFGRFDYPNELGPGVYDIHSPRVPTVEEMVALIERAARVVPISRLWVNPDCGLKTRAWPEVAAALANMVAAASAARRLQALLQGGPRSS